jgi:hypothetical protein
MHIMPKSAVDLPWRLSQNYVQDRVDMKSGEIEDGWLQMEAAPAQAVRLSSQQPSGAALEAAE